jgi:transcriptional regulator with XRE-family HTH domain
MTSAITSPFNAVKALRKAAGLSQEQLAEAVGMSHSNVGRIERGLVPLSEEHLPAFAAALGVRPADIFAPPDEIVRRRPKTTRLVGYVGAGAAAHFYASADEGLGEVNAPPDADETLVAAEIRGASLGPLFDGWLIYYDDVRTPVTSDLIGELCIVGLSDGRVLVKKLRRSKTEGFYHLESNIEETLFDQEVIWAARVKQMMPR